MLQLTRDLGLPQEPHPEMGIVGLLGPELLEGDLRPSPLSWTSQMQPVPPVA